jgi:hypothetical protein
MNQIYTYLLPVLAALMLAGCASEPTRYSSGPIQAHTFNFIHMEQDQNPTLAAKRAETHELIQGAIKKDLTTKGLTQVATNGDVAVLYLIVVSDGSSTQTINDYYGFSDSSYELQDKAHQVFAIEKRNQTGYAAGTLVIDIVDMRQGKVLWRNFVYRPILADLPMEQRQVRLQEAVNEVLKGLRVSTKSN